MQPELQVLNTCQHMVSIIDVAVPAAVNSATAHHHLG